MTTTSMSPLETANLPAHTSAGSLGLRRAAKVIGLPMALGTLLLFSWWLVAAREWVNPLLLPPPHDVWQTLVARLTGDGVWWPHIGATMLEMSWGFAIGVAAGLGLGAIFAFFESARFACYPFVFAFQAFPKIAIAPLLAVALGYGYEPKIVVAATLAYFPVMTAAIAGFTELNSDELNLMRSMGASRRQEMRYLRLPNAMSYLFPSLDLALLSALLGAVAAELVGAKQGLGYLLVERQAFGDTASIFAVLIVLAVIGVVLRTAIVTLRRSLPRSVVPR